MALFFGPLSFFLLAQWPSPDPAHPQTMLMAGIVSWVAIWWFTEAVDLAVTSLLPFLLLPITGILGPVEAAALYMDPIIFLFLGGFMLAFAMERWGLHTRLAFAILQRTGSSPPRVLAGIMASTFLLSMWVSNTATVLLLIPAVLAVIRHIRDDQGTDGRHPVAIALLLGLAYSATMGGMTTLVGTPPNMYFYSFYQRTFPGDASVNFASFFVQSGVITASLALFTYGIIRWRYLRQSTGQLSRTYFQKAYRDLGKMHRDQKVVITVFALTVLAWFTRPDMQLGDRIIRGWASWSGLEGRVHDGMVAILACLILFVIPARNGFGRILEWKDVERLPYGIVLLFGSGFALAAGFEASGLSALVATRLEGLRDVHPLLLLLTIGIVITVISEFASNIACVQLVLPVVLTLTNGSDLSVKGMLFATALFASLGFMMPVATAPNTIIFGSGEVKTSDLVRTGLWLNLAGVLLISLFVYWWHL